MTSVTQFQPPRRTRRSLAFHSLPRPRAGVRGFATWCERLESRYVLCPNVTTAASGTGHAVGASTVVAAECVDSPEEQPVQSSRNRGQQSGLGHDGGSRFKPLLSDDTLRAITERSQVFQRAELAPTPRETLPIPPSLPLHHRVWVSKSPRTEPPQTSGTEDETSINVAGTIDDLNDFWQELGMALKDDSGDGFELDDLLSVTLSVSNHPKNDLRPHPPQQKSRESNLPDEIRSESSDRNSSRAPVERIGSNLMRWFVPGASRAADSTIHTEPPHSDGPQPMRPTNVALPSATAPNLPATDAAIPVEAEPNDEAMPK